MTLTPKGGGCRDESRHNEGEADVLATSPAALAPAGFAGPVAGSGCASGLGGCQQWWA